MMAGNCLPALLPLAAALVAGVSLVPLSHSDYLPPLQQVRDGGVDPEDVQCNTSLVHAVRANGAHVCVRETTAERMGWEVFAAKEAAPAGAGDGSSADGGPGAQPYDPRYYVGDDKITLQHVERKLPNPTGVWMPVTKEEAEQVVMPRLAAGLGDRPVLPALTRYESCVQNARSYCSSFLDGSNPYSRNYYEYNTEKGNMFKAWRTFGVPDFIHTIEYRVYDRIPYEEREEFFGSLMERAGFNVTTTNIEKHYGIIYGDMLSANLGFLADARGPFMQLIFYGWTNDYPEGYLLSKEELKRRAHAFAAAHANLWDEEECTLSLHGVGAVDVYHLTVVAGVPLYAVEVGYCSVPYYPEIGLQSQSVMVEATEGEIIWPTRTGYLVGDWIDRIDIPESARVKHGNNEDGGGPQIPPGRVLPELAQ